MAERKPLVVRPDDVVGIALDVLDCWDGLRLLLDHQEGEARPGSEYDAGGALDLVNAAFRDRLTVLGAVYDLVADVWVADHPPEFDPPSASVLEGVVRAVARWAQFAALARGLLVDLRTKPPAHPPRPAAGWRATHLFVARHCVAPPGDAMAASLRCEAKAIGPGLPGARPIPARDACGSPFRAIAHAALQAAALSLPDGWQRMADAERLVAAGQAGPPGPAPAGTAAPGPLPHWDGSTRVLTIGGVPVRKYARQPALNQVAILAAFQAAGWPPTIDGDSLRRNNGGAFDSKAINDAVTHLNAGISPKSIRFVQRGDGRSVGWTASPSSR